jgi:hypothetical protein
VSGHFADEPYDMAFAERHADQHARHDEFRRVATVVEQDRQRMVQRDADEHVTHASAEIRRMGATRRRIVVPIEQTANPSKLK